MSINGNQTVTGVNPLVSQLTQKLDTNRDGNLSVEEFQVFLAKFLQAGSAAATGTTAQPAAVVRQAWTRQNVLETLQRYGAATQANLVKAVEENPWLGEVAGNGKIRDIYGSGETWDVIGNFSDTTGATAHWQTLTGHTAIERATSGKGITLPDPFNLPHIRSIGLTQD